MDLLKRARRPVQSEFEILYGELDQLLKAKPLDKNKIEVAYNLFAINYEALQIHDGKVKDLMVLEDYSEEDEEKELAEIRKYRKRAETIRLLKEKAVPFISSSTESVMGNCSDQTTRSFRLLKVEFRKFNGELKGWIAFWAQFEKIDEDQTIHGSDKFWYLSQALEPGSEPMEILNGYPQSAENYPKVIEALKKRYGNEDLLLRVYIEELLTLVIANVKRKDKIPLKKLQLQLDSHLRALKSLNLEKADPASWLFPLVEASLPERVLYNWHNSPLAKMDGSQEDPPKTRLDFLMEFLEKETTIQQQIESTRTFAAEQSKDEKDGKPSIRDKKYDKKQPSTLSSFHAGDSKKCVFCSRTNHQSRNCFKARDMTQEDKLELLKKLGLCFRCCGKHLSRDCDGENLKCKKCGGRHFTVLCPGGKRKREDDKDERDSTFKRPRKDSTNGAVSVAANLECTSDVALQSFLCRLRHGNRTEIVRGFMDSGCQRSYILQSTTRKLKSKPVDYECVAHNLFGGRHTTEVLHGKHRIMVESLDGSFRKLITLRDNQQLCGRIPTVAMHHPNLIKYLATQGVLLSDGGVTPRNIELLIGADLIGTISTGEIVNLRDGAIAQNTRFGWTVLGEVGEFGTSEVMDSIHLSMSATDIGLVQLWELEALGITDPFFRKEADEMEETALKQFRASITRAPDGRYIVKFPWKEKKSVLPFNKDQALKRLHSTTRKLMQMGLFKKYSELFKEWEAEGFIERVPTSSSRNLYYISHRPVVRLEKKTTPVRPVFDASCRLGKFPSLNDILFTGKNYVLLIPSLLLKFREKLIGFVADIRKAFQMIGVAVEDRDVMRFLWWANELLEELIEYRHCCVMFGATCSPYILGAVIEYHLGSLPEEELEFGKKLLSRLYVDNCLSSEQTMEEYEEFKGKSTEIFQRAKMDLRLWMSNRDGFEDPSTWVTSVLGLLWDRKEDTLFVNVKDIQVPAKISKRTILSTVQKVFDPIGFTSPGVLPAKLMLQRTWMQNLKWDDDLPDTEATLFVKWCEQLPQLAEIRIPRSLTVGLEDRNTWELHTFSDASQDAYATVVFLRVGPDNCATLFFLGGKSRVAPVKKEVKSKSRKSVGEKMTIPKLELMGCLIGARLTASVKNALEVSSVPEYYWSDSTTALAWIKREHSWGTFVANRAKAIRDLSNPEHWRHVPGNCNPADLPSRGCLPSDLVELKWWEGPTWLRQPKLEWPSVTFTENEEEIMAELKKSSPRPAVISFTITDRVKEYSFQSKVRIYAWARRFLHNKIVKSENRKTGPLIKMELDRAEIVLVRDLQRRKLEEDDFLEKVKKEKWKYLKGLEYFQDDWGVLRVKTRLTYRKDLNDFKYPMILPGDLPEVRRLINDLHVAYCHAGTGFLMMKMRQKYWIPQARRTIKSVITKCPRCQRFRAEHVQTPGAPLPLDRIRDAEVFEVTGVDLAGPLYLRNGNKVWLVLFTCGIYRAVHFEMVGALSTRAFIYALGNFIRKFRRPETIYCDNGTNFRGTKNLFDKLDWNAIKANEGVKKIEFKFIPALSPWWGGWWERVIRTAKDLLKRTVGKGILTWKELEIVISKIEEVINERPLTYVSEDPEDLEPLTPAMFLHPFGKAKFPEKTLTESQRMRIRWDYMKTLQDELRNRFRREYLAYLVNYNRNPEKITRELVPGDLVFVGSDGRKRIDWVMGKVLEIMPGGDGVGRVAKVKTEKGDFIRTVQRLYPLELDTQEDLEKEMQRQGRKTRSGRVVKVPKRFR